jgi:hypothetical protein
MATIPLPPDFLDFLKLLNSHGVEYLVIGGYAVGLHGFPRGTADLDIWVAMNPRNANAITDALREFGFDTPNLSSELFLKQDEVVRMGVPPVRIDILTTIAGVTFEACFPKRETVVVSGATIPFISLEDLRKNKQATGRAQDLTDLRHLP